MVHNRCIVSQSELKILQGLADSIQPGRSPDHIPPDILQLREQIEKECGRIKDQLTKFIFTQARENLAERFIQYHQAGIIALTNQLQSVLPAGNEPALQLATGFFISRLCDLLDYIERFFCKYFDLDAAVPRSYRLITLKQLGEDIRQLLFQVEERLQSPLLKSCLTDYLRPFIEEGPVNDLTFRDLAYLKTFLAETTGLLKSPATSDPDDQLSKVLIYLNFNHLGFLVYYQDRTRSELDHSDSAEQHLATLASALSQIKSLQSKPNASYSPAWPPIRTMLETWLGDEITMAVMQREKGPVLPAGGTGVADKMALNVSVAQLACITRLLFEENYYGLSSITDILKFTVGHFRSKRQEHISLRSISKEYYDTTQVTAAWVRDLLQRMTARINKTYFPVWVAVCLAVAGCS